MNTLENLRTRSVPARARRKLAGSLAFLCALAMTGAGSRVFACAACFGKSDSAMARSINAGIFSLMAVIVTVLVGAASFFVFLARRAATAKEADQTGDAPKAQS
jgi:heme/copper-type cytochrome/quinol oxidase subunit 2